MDDFVIPKGTRDFSSIEIKKRNYLIKIIREKFEIFGFSPIETPSFENLSTLMEKYGQEGDYLIFKLLRSGDILKNKLLNYLNNNKNNFDIINYTTIIKEISNKGLRYDLTVPFVRYVSMHRNEITFPFKRYQIQPVWRADNPQQGRFREFYQCDADMIGSQSVSSLWQEIDFLKLCDEIFNALNFSVIININHIDILKGLAEISGIKNHLWKDFIASLDKWNKMGKHVVKHEMIQKGISYKSFEKISIFFDMKEDFDKKIDIIIKAFQYSKTGIKGVKDISFIFQNMNKLSLKKIKLQWNMSLSRGMNYYTGTIFEITAKSIIKKQNDVVKHKQSIGGGGRYDKLSSYFGMKNFSGIGISFGLDRIYIYMEKHNLFSIINNCKFPPSKVLFINFGETEVIHAYHMISCLRDHGISTQLYPNAISIKKQFLYADKNNIPFTISIGKQEIENKKIKVKNINNRIEIEYDNLQNVIQHLTSYFKSNASLFVE
ncbi:histidine--tRNA ligase [Blattabacterium cuenoti]|uniref:histidine--tRNA ligase n=1 Tax=Blattabacterium cuenoti TaxID=1653831 RepID=UPI00163D2652|nr:histidine--tRNA ligase [Blattabacterium cuenoti]